MFVAEDLSREARLVTYLVSGAGDIAPAHENIRRSGRRVRHGRDVVRSAVDELRQDMRYVVVAHGDGEGTVYWATDDKPEGDRWLWVGMSPAPARSRVYLYCCHAGPLLSRYLKNCECFGHCSEVPAPVDEAREVVLSYLDQVDRLMDEEDFNVGRWRSQLAAFVGERLDMELENPSSLLGPAFWVALSKSLNSRADSVV